MERVSFKSIPEMYEKEKSGIKNNTVRLVDIFDKRFDILEDISNEVEIEIINTETKESFIRKIRDVTFFYEYCVITWKHEED